MAMLVYRTVRVLIRTQTMQTSLQSFSALLSKVALVNRKSGERLWKKVAWRQRDPKKLVRPRLLQVLEIQVLFFSCFFLFFLEIPVS